MGIMKDKTREQKVYEFHKAMSLDISSKPRGSLVALRSALVAEEAQEVKEAFNVIETAYVFSSRPTKENWEHLLKELCDLQYVISGAIVALEPISGDFDVAFNRVHKSNMSKLDDNGEPVKNTAGKVIKGENYKPPELGDLII